MRFLDKGLTEHAGFSLPTIGAVTDKVSHQVHAKSAIPTRIRRALILICNETKTKIKSAPKRIIPLLDPGFSV